MQIVKLVKLSNGKMDGSDRPDSLQLEEYVPEVFSGKLADYAYWKRVSGIGWCIPGWIRLGNCTC